MINDGKDRGEELGVLSLAVLTNLTPIFCDKKSR